MGVRARYCKQRNDGTLGMHLGVFANDLLRRKEETPGLEWYLVNDTDKKRHQPG
jgi:hypothetical protein